MPISSTTLSYGLASFASCLDYHISLLVSLSLAFIFAVKCYFFLKNLTCIIFFRGSLMTRIQSALIITRLSLSVPFPPSTLSYTVSLGGPKYAMLLHLPFIAQLFVSMKCPLLGLPSFEKLQFNTTSAKPFLPPAD